MDSTRATTAFTRDEQRFVEELLVFLRFPTISAQQDHAEDMHRCAAWVQQQLAAAGLQAEIWPTQGHPAVFADSGPAARADAPTLLVYGHYDVQPIGDETLWKSPAFEPTIRDGKIYARGSADDKGQVWIHIVAARAAREAGERLPVRLKFLIEGEEEIGSPHLPALLNEHRDRLTCDAVVISDTSRLGPDTAALTVGTRGLVYKQITLTGPDHDLHSGQFGGAVANPVNVLARIIASLHDDQHSVTIPGFYDDVRSLSAAERAALIELGGSDADVMAATGAPGVAGEAGFTTIERRTVRPTLDVNGIIGGYTGKGAATIIPSTASAKVSMRLVPDQDPAKISAAFDEAVRAACPPTCRIEIVSSQGCRAYVAPADSPAMRLARQALTEGYGQPAALLREGGTLPILPLFREVLRADSIMMGFADPNCNLHSPNEFFHLQDFTRGVRCVLRFLELMGGE